MDARIDECDDGYVAEVLCRAPRERVFGAVATVSLVERGAGTPYTASADALRVVRAYHRAWTGKDFAAAARFLAPDLATDVPLNTYPTRADFVTALTGFGALVRRVDLLAEFGSGDQALLLYDMHTDDFGTIRIAEQFTVAEGLIRRIRHVHDTAALRAAA